MGLEFADGATFQAGDVDVVAGAVAFVEVLAAAEVEQVELVDQAIAFQEINGAVDGDTVHVRVDFLGAVEDGAGVEVALGVVHDLEQDFSLAREAHAALCESCLQAAGALVGVDAFAGGDSMCGYGHEGRGAPRSAKNFFGDLAMKQFASARHDANARPKAGATGYRRSRAKKVQSKTKLAMRD